MVIQHSQKILHLEAGFSWPEYLIFYIQKYLNTTPQFFITICHKYFAGSIPE